MPLQLLELADELLLAIAEQIDDQESLRNAARTCSRLQALAEPFIYQHVFYTSRAQLISLSQSIEARPERAKAIRSIDSRVRYSTTDFDLTELVNLMRETVNLQAFTYESPFCNRRQPGVRTDLSHFFRPLQDNTPRLTNCRTAFS